jgi:hypothetical protein
MALKKPKCVGKKLKNIAPNTQIIPIALNRCYRQVRFIPTEIESKNKTFFFSFLCGGKIKI